MMRFARTLPVLVAILGLAACGPDRNQEESASTTAPSTSAPAFVGPTTLPGSASTTTSSTSTTTTTTPTTSTSTTTTTTVVEGSFAALRKVCQTSDDRKVVDSLVIALKGAVPTTPIEDVKKELKKLLKKEGNLLTLSIGRAPEDSCLHELQKFLPEFTPSNGGGNSGHGGSGGGNGGGGNVGNGGGGPGTPVDHNCPSGQIWNGSSCGTATPVVVPPGPSSTTTSTTTTTTPSGGGGSTSSTSSTTTTVAIVCPIFREDGSLDPRCA